MGTLTLLNVPLDLQRVLLHQVLDVRALRQKSEGENLAKYSFAEEIS